MSDPDQTVLFEQSVGASQQAADPILAKYTGELPAADAFTFDNAYHLFESLRIEAGVLGPFGNHS